jgi:dolichyl-phosphate beta-glucosyltransferase
MSQPTIIRPLLSLIIPAFNESAYIATVLQAACDYLKQQDYASEVLVVDDGSRDDTRAQVEPFTAKYNWVRLLSHPENSGKGAAVRTGMLHGVGDYLVFTDADLSYAIEDIRTMLTILRGGADVAIGSRNLKDSQTLVSPPLLRSLLSKIFSLVVQLLAIRGIPDTQCGFKGFTHHAAVEIFSRLSVTGFAFDVEVLVLARSLGYSIEPVPVHYVARETSKVRVLRDSLRMLAQLLRIRANQWSGIYNRATLTQREHSTQETGLPPQNHSLQE